MPRKRSFVWILLVFLVTVFLATRGAQAQAPDVSSLKHKAVVLGQVPIIVGLKLPDGFKREGDLHGPTGVAQQRRAIAATRDALRASLQGFNAHEYKNWESVPAVALQVDAAALDFLALQPLVTSIQEDALSQPLLASATNFIGADKTFSQGFGGLGQAVVIVDTGIDADHPFFGGNGINPSPRVIEQACFSNGPGGGVSLCTNGATGPGSADVTVGAMADATHCDTNGANLCDHGSHVAGIAAGRDPGGANATGYNGVAPQASIVAIQVGTRINSDLLCGGTGTAPCVLISTSDEISALNYVNTMLLPLHPGIVAVNMSLGSSTRNTTACDGDVLKAPIDNLLSKNIVTVIAAGNEGFTDGVSNPGCISTAVTVGSVDDGTNGTVAGAVSSFSNMGSLVDLLAVGHFVDSSIPDDTFANLDGTSQATPEVTGAFAVLRAIRPNQSAADTLAFLRATGVPVTDTRPPNPPGGTSGSIKPRIALAAAVTPPVPTLSQWGIVLLVLSLMTAATILFARDRILRA